jgi:hypothetical protein
MTEPMTIYFHNLENKKLDEVKKYIMDRYDSIEFIIEFENNIIHINKMHTKNYEARIIIDLNNNVKSCYVKYLHKIKNNNCMIL